MDAAGTAAIDVAVRVHLHAIGCTCRVTRSLSPDATVGERAVGVHVEHANVLGLRIVDVELPLVAGEAQPVGLAEVGDQCS